jgi:hypothetical protein
MVRTLNIQRERNPMNKPEDYKHIRAWGVMLQSYEYYIRQQQETAAHDDAPITAVYKRDDRWITIEECSPTTQTQVNDYVARMK